MTALSNERQRRQEAWTSKVFTLTGVKAWKGARIFLSPGTGKVTIGAATPGLIPIGIAKETVDATSADQSINVDLEREIIVERFVNGTSSDAIAATDLGSLAYMLDDQTVSILAAGHPVCGRIWDVDATKGIAVEKLTPSGEKAQLPATASFTSNDWAPATVINGAVYDVPTTGAGSTITLPAAAADGTIIYFAADGTKNGNTVQYRDATGPTNLTTALTASKRHLVVAAKRGGNWFANAYVSP